MQNIILVSAGAIMLENSLRNVAFIHLVRSLFVFMIKEYQYSLFLDFTSCIKSLTLGELLGLPCFYRLCKSLRKIKISHSWSWRNWPLNHCYSEKPISSLQSPEQQLSTPFYVSSLPAASNNNTTSPTTPTIHYLSIYPSIYL